MPEQRVKVAMQTEESAVHLLTRVARAVGDEAVLWVHFPDGTRRQARPVLGDWMGGTEARPWPDVRVIEAEDAPGGAPIDHPNLRQVERRLRASQEENAEAHRLLDALGIPKGPEVSPPTVLERLKVLADRLNPQPPVMADAPDREAQLLEQREQARAGEDRFKAERDAALHLLRWLIGDLIPADLIRFQADEEEDG